MFTKIKHKNAPRKLGCIASERSFINSHMKFFLLFVSIATYNQVIFAQTDTLLSVIHGTVSDSKTNNHLPLANVSIMGLSIKTTTDQNGKYKLTLPDSALKYESIKIAYSYPGYFIDTLTVNTKQIPTVLNSTLLEKHALFAIAFRPYTIIGYTINSITHKPLTGVKIKVKCIKSSTKSRSDGTFTIAFPKGTKLDMVTIRFSKKGFNTTTIQIDISGWTKEMVICLAEKMPN